MNVASVLTSSCYDTWANPTPWGTDVISYVSINAVGYGNHCGYAVVPSIPTVRAICHIPFCATVYPQAGAYDSNYGATHFNDRRAAGWANINFSIGDFWACRAYVDTSGNGSGFCS